MIAAGRSERVLLAEDDAELRALLARALRKRDLQVVEVDSGAALLEQLWEESHFDLIISDLNMPGCDGLDVLEGLRDECEPGIGSTPIILMTAFGGPAARREAARLGALFVDKPFDVDALGQCALQLIRAQH